MPLSKGPSLAVSRPTVQQLLDSVESARPTLGIMCDVYKSRIHDLMNRRGSSLDSPASKKMRSEIDTAFFFGGVGLQAEKKKEDESVDTVSDDAVVVMPQEEASFPRLYRPRVVASEPDPDNNDPQPQILPFTAATAASIYKVFGTGALHNGNH